MLGNSFFIVVAGFTWGFRSVTRKVFALDTSKPWKTWQRLDKVPVAITHSALAVVNDTLIAICGGYVGGAPGPHTDDCFVLDPFLRRGQQWSRIAKLPDGGRAGGGMIYDSLLNALVFAAGAQRPERNQRTAIDFNTTWMYSFDNPDAGWVVKAPIPFRGNHLSSVTAVDASGHERHYFAGGQKEEDEANGNSADHYEYDAVQNVWIPRQFLPIPRGHASSSTRATGTCGGYIVAAGCTNGDQKIADVSYYDIARDAWTSIGNLTRTMNTPVCDFGFGERGNVLYCESGSDRKWFSQKIEIAFS